MKKILYGLCVVCLLFTISMTSFAAVVAYGSEDAGYLVSTSQLRKKTNTFDDSDLNKTYKTYMTYAARVWKESGVVTMKRNKNSENKIGTYRSENTLTVAYTQSTTSLRTGKITSFKIMFNRAEMDGRKSIRNKATAAHEMGHSLGLLDLYEAKNKDKLMYGITDRLAKKPTKKDIKGGNYATRK